MVEFPARNNPWILIAEDDEDDRLLTMDAMREAEILHHVRFVENGEDLLDCLRKQKLCVEEGSAPSFVLMDLNMPRMDGRQALAAIKSDASIRHIPIVVLTTSRDDADIAMSYDLGAASFISKPVSFAELVEVMRVLGAYWTGIVKLPEDDLSDSRD